MLWSEREESTALKIKGNSFIEGLMVSYLKDGNTVWTLTARRADFTQGETKAILTDVTVKVHENDMSLHTGTATYDLLTQNITTKGEIRADTKDYTITTASIDYEASSREIKTEDSITVEGKRFKVEGKGMMLDKEQKVRILKDVKAIFYK